MAYSARLEEDLINTEYHTFSQYDEFMFVRKLILDRDVKDVKFRAIEDGEQLCAARDLLNDRYGWRGYGSAHNIPSGAHHTTFTAEVDQNVVGTITLAIDSEFGLALDSTFGDEVNEIRDEGGARICELTRLAFHSCVRSKEVLAGLFHFVFIYGTTISDCTDLLIEINPRHACFYETMLGFERVGPLKTNGSVAAPSQLMRLKVDAIRKNISELAGSANPTSKRSLYYNFFPHLQETQIRCLLMSNAMMRSIRYDSRHRAPNYSQIEDETPALTHSLTPLGSAGLPDPRDMGVTANAAVRRAA